MKVEVQLQAEVREQCDVLVIGGGPAGFAAAVAAARCGKKTVLLEASGQLGGMSTLANVAIFMSVGNCMGIYKEILQRLLPDYDETKDYKDECPQFNPLIMRYVLLQMAEEAGVKLYFHTKYVSPVMEGKRITGVIAATREGVIGFTGTVVVDCTGDGRVAIDSGAAYTTGRQEDGLTQPCTLMLQMQDTGKPVTPFLPEGCTEYHSIEELPQGRLLHWERNTEGTLLVNMTRVKANGAKAEDVNRLESEALRQAFSVAYYLQTHGYETYILSTIGSQTGVRETNQIKGLYTLNESDLLNGTKFPDVVAQTNYEIDIHSPDGSGTTFEQRIDSYDIPYRCMVPEGVEGMLVAGRAISATHVAVSSLRVMPTCYALGQAAGVAAAIACEENSKLSDITIHKLQQGLAAQNVKFY